MCSNLPTHIDILATYTKKNELYKYLILLTNQLITIALLYCTKNNCLHNLNLTRIFILNSRRLTNTFSGPYYYLEYLINKKKVCVIITNENIQHLI